MSDASNGSSAPSGLFVDLYELTMAQAYWRQKMHERAVFSLFVRRLPKERNYLLFCGLDDVLSYLESVRFDSKALGYLSKLNLFAEDFLSWLSDWRFSGDVWAMPEGSVFFADEPVLEIEAPLPQAQMLETFVLNQVHMQTVIASKAARVVDVAAGRKLVDFGMRRVHGTDAALKSARAAWIAGWDATSNVEAAHRFGIPVSGTMAHSYVQAHESEAAAFSSFVAHYPEAILLVDTYDSRAGVSRAIQLARELGPAFRVRGVRLDSGDIAPLAFSTRAELDRAGLSTVEIFASGGLDEYRISELLSREAPIDGFGVGTKVGVSADAPYLDMVYKLTEYGGRGRLKTSSDKETLPGRKQVYRVIEGGTAKNDVLATTDELQLGEPMLRQMMSGGLRRREAHRNLNAARERARQQRLELPVEMRRLAASLSFPVEKSANLRAKTLEASRKALG